MFGCTINYLGYYNSRSLFRKAEGFGRSPTGNKGPFTGLCSLLATKNESMGYPAFNWEIAQIERLGKREITESESQKGICICMKRIIEQH